ncbi:MAG: helix-hairpin-helix domain-containing protein, partial [Eubacterium sp.]
MKLENSVRELSGVGPKRAEALANNGIHTIEDLLDFYPRKYLNRKMMGSLLTETDEPVTITAVILKKGTLRRIRRNMSLFVLPVVETLQNGKTVKGEIVWFNQPYLGNVFVENETYYFFGKVTV